MTGASVQVVGLDVALEDTLVLHEVSLEVPAGGIVAVVGPSGSGKSTLLRAIAGLVTPSRGAVHLDGVDVGDVPTHRRGVGMVAQHGALFPHLDVGRNIAFGLHQRGRAGSAARQRVGEVLELVGLPGFERRPVTSLSGGERQRVALARALAPRPSVLLLDEPLAALDRSLRDRLVEDLGNVLRFEDTSALHVTHDQQEASMLAESLIVLRGGRVVQAGEPGTVFDDPVDEWVARFLGHRNVLELRTLSTALVRALGGADAAAGDTVVIAETSLRLHDAEGVEGTVVSSHRAPARPGVLVSVAGVRLWAAPGAGPLPPRGAAVTIGGAPGTIRALPADAPPAGA